MNITGQTLIESAYRDLNILLPTSEQIQQTLDDLLNPMLARWSTESLLRSPLVVEESFQLTAGVAVYTIGSGGTFNTVRPIRIMDAFIRDADNIDYPVDVLLSLEDFNRLANKDYRARPDKLYYAAEYPLGKIQFNTTPSVAHTFKAFSWKPLPIFTTLATVLVVPDEYMEPIRMNLAVLLAPRNSIVLDSLYVQAAIGGQMMLRNLNAPVQPLVQHDSAITWNLQR